MNNKKILLVKTHGCSACKCMEHILDMLQDDISDLDVEITYYPNVPKHIREKIKFNDFPTTIFIKDDNVVDWFVGTKSVKNIKTIINNINF